MAAPRRRASRTRLRQARGASLPRKYVPSKTAAAPTNIGPLDLLTHTRAFFNIGKVSPQVIAGHLTHTRQIFAIAKVSPQVRPALLTHTRAFFAIGKVSPQVIAQYLTHTRANFVPTVTSGTALVATHLTHTRVIQTPTVSPQLRPGLLTHGTRGVFSPTASSFAQILPGALSHTRQIFSPQVSVPGPPLVRVYLSHRNKGMAIRPLFPS